MTSPSRIPVYRDDDDELLGYVTKDKSSWQAQTIFGYTLERTTSQAQAERILREQGLGSLMGKWEYYDSDERQWFPCIIKEAYEQKVIVLRTNEAGYQDPDTYKLVTLKHPTEEVLVKAG